MKPFEKPTIYTVSGAHLDTIWNWDFEKTIRTYIPRTLKRNFRRFKLLKNYTFSFEGSHRYELMEEYYPELFEELKKAVQEGRWHVTGSAYENGDVNVPSPEALFRNILYGNSYFSKTFGKRSVDIYLPDCFGFGHALPSIASHANLKGFTTQKLSWGSAYGIPFDLGIWYGIDGKPIYASLNAGSYVTRFSSVRTRKDIKEKLDNNLAQFGLPATYRFHGVGDRGGAPRWRSALAVAREVRKNENSDSIVLAAPADQAFRDMDVHLTEDQKAKLPTWKNELVATNHGVGSYTSRAIGKRWNKRCELLADAAERSLVTAEWIGVIDYPKNVLDTAWKRVIAHQFHDDITGTSLQHCYLRSWNDYVLSLNQFEKSYTAGVGAVASLMDASFAKGTVIAVSNPVQGERTQVVEAKIKLPSSQKNVSVFDAAGNIVPSQIAARAGDDAVVLFVASMPSVGYALYDIRESAEACSENTGLRVTENSLENERYTVTLDANGDICTIYDKQLEKQLLKEPIRMALHAYEGNATFPAWELVYDEVMRQPCEFAANPVFTISDDGPVRVSLTTKRTAGNSTFVQKITLDCASDIVIIENEIDWQGYKRLLKTPFVLQVENDVASYDLGLGIIKRGVNTPSLYEVPAQSWADISTQAYGVSILSDSKHGWDRPAANTLRLTGIHTPAKNFRKESQQSQMDLGRNRYGFAIFSHPGNDLSSTQKAAMQFVQPPHTFELKSTSALLPASFSFADVNNPEILIRAIKKAHETDEIVVRFQEGTGKAHTGIRFQIGNGIRGARELFASEEYKGEACIQDGELCFDMGAFEPKTFALTLKPFEKPVEKAAYSALALPMNINVASPQSKPRNGVLYGKTIPAELYPKEIICGEMVYPTATTEHNALVCQRQTIALPQNCEALSFIATSTAGDKQAKFKIGEEIHSVKIADCMEPIGVWDLHSTQIKGRIKKDTLAWNATHMHTKKGDAIAKQCYLFEYILPIAPGTKEITLPQDENIILFAAVARTAPRVKASGEMFD